MKQLWNLVSKNQKGRILEYMLMHNNRVEVFRLITPRSMNGLGVAQYNARIKELREELEPLGYNIKNEAGKYFEIVEESDQATLF